MLICLFVGCASRPIDIKMIWEDHSMERIIKDIEDADPFDWLKSHVEITGEKVFVIDMMYDGEFMIFEDGIIFRGRNDVDPEGRYKNRIKRLFRKLERGLK